MLRWIFALGLAATSCGSSTTTPEAVCTPQCGPLQRCCPACGGPQGRCVSDFSGACPVDKCAQPGAACGSTFCNPGMVCCNASCGICTPPDAGCTQQACADATPGIACGDAGICAADAFCFDRIVCGGVPLPDSGSCRPDAHSCQTIPQCGPQPTCACLTALSGNPCSGASFCAIEASGTVTCHADVP